jgi:hypothetical protein
MPVARPRVAQILEVPADKGSVEKAMAAASIRPDTEFREEDKSTAGWHYIDICLQDSETDLPARCPFGNVSRQKSTSTPVVFAIATTINGAPPAT